MKKSKAKLLVDPLLIDGYSDVKLSGIYLAFQLGRNNSDIMNKLKDNIIAVLYYQCNG